MVTDGLHPKCVGEKMVSCIARVLCQLAEFFKQRTNTFKPEQSKRSHDQVISGSTSARHEETMGSHARQWVQHKVCVELYPGLKCLL